MLAQSAKVWKRLLRRLCNSGCCLFLKRYARYFPVSKILFSLALSAKMTSAHMRWEGGEKEERRGLPWLVQMKKPIEPVQIDLDNNFKHSRSILVKSSIPTSFSQHRNCSARATPVEKLGGEGDGIVPSWLVQRNRGNWSKRCKLIGQYSFQTKIAVPPHSRFWSKSNTPPPLSRNINILQVAPLKSTRLAERKASDTRDWTLET